MPKLSKLTVRLLAWSFAVAAIWAIWQELAFAQGVAGNVEVENPETDFLGQLLRSIFLFDSSRLMTALSRPEFAIPAFIALNLIIFTETGLLIGFFLPGDSLLVITGMICARDDCGWNMPLLLTTLSLSAIIGDTVGYWIGYKSGPKIFNREQSFFFAKDHLLKAQEFYVQHGGKTIILARFVPFLRTFAPVVAGVGRMEYKQFLSFNVIGGIGWIFSMVLAGYFLPSLLNPVLGPTIAQIKEFFGVVPDNQPFLIEKHIEKVVILVVFLSITPIIYAWLKSKLTAKKVEPAPDQALCVKYAYSEPRPSGRGNVN